MNKMKEILDELWREGQETLNIYFAEDISPGDENWFVDVMQDEINERCNTNWTWTVISRKEFEQENEEEEIPDWDIIVDKPFSDIVVKEAIENWLKERGYKFNVNLIPFEEAKGSGYIKNLRERLESKDDFVRLDEINWDKKTTYNRSNTSRLAVIIGRLPANIEFRISKGDAGHIRGYNFSVLENQLIMHGFKIVKKETNGIAIPLYHNFIKKLPQPLVPFGEHIIIMARNIKTQDLVQMNQGTEID